MMIFNNIIQVYMAKTKITMSLIFILVAAAILSASPLYVIKAGEQSTVDEDFIIKDGVLVKYAGEGGEVIVPEGVISIGQSSFQFNKNVTSVTIPDTVLSIEKWAFMGCSNLARVKMHDAVTSIGYEAFWNCEKLVEISSLEGITSIGAHAFELTPWLITRREENPLVIINGILIDGSTCIGAVTIPDMVTQIAGKAFSFNKELSSITIPNSVTSIGSSAFSNCNNLITVKMANSISALGEYTFELCVRLKNVRLSNGIKLIDAGVFSKCKALTRITIPYSVSKIERSAFDGCINLKYVTASNNLINVEQYGIGVFDTCPNRIFYGLENSYIQSYAKDKSIPFKKLALTETKKILSVGDVYRLAMNSMAVCTWKSSNTSIANVNYYGVITANKKGIVTITATIYKRSYQCVVTIK